MNNKNHTVLLIDDDPDDVLLITEALKNSRPALNIIHKKNGREALDYLREIYTLNTSLPGLIITDMNMPMVSGRQMLALLKAEKNFQSIPVIVFTTSSNDGDKDFCRQFNIPLVTKPNNLDSFDKKVQEFIKECGL